MNDNNKWKSRNFQINMSSKKKMFHSNKQERLYEIINCYSRKGLGKKLTY